VWTGGQRVCRYDTIGVMDTLVGQAGGLVHHRPGKAGTPVLLGILATLMASSPAAAAAQTADEPVTVSSEHPRLFLRPARLRLLKRERDRTSARWQQLEALVMGGAPMPERGFADALYYAVTGDAAAGRRAVAWALGRDNDLRQQALVFDWCQELLSDAQRRELTSRLEKGIAETAGADTVAAVRSRVLAAVALFDHVPRTPQRELERVVHTWWEAKMAPALKSGRSVLKREDAYPLLELLHALRDNANLDLRESCPLYFKDYPIEHLMTYYPPPYPAPDGDYYIGMTRKIGEPDLREAALSRAAELAMVAYDANAPSSQILQGWLMHDKFILRGTFGAPYEFLWANPYQPGLSYYLAPLVYYNAEMGRLFVRSSWDDSARWFGYFDGVMQIFEDGRVTAISPQLAAGPISLDQAVVCLAQTARKFQLEMQDEALVFLVGLEPLRKYEVEIDDEEMYEAAADMGGILELELPHGKDVGVRLK